MRKTRSTVTFSQSELERQPRCDVKIFENLARTETVNFKLDITNIISSVFLVNCPSTDLLKL